MRDAKDMDVHGRLLAADELLAQGHEGEARELVEYVLAHRTGLPAEDAEDMAGSCGLSARLLALRGEQVRAGLLADLAVWLARGGTPRPCPPTPWEERAQAS